MLKTLLLYLLLTTPAFCAYTDLCLTDHVANWHGIAFVQDYVRQRSNHIYPVYIINVTCTTRKGVPCLEVDCYDEPIGLAKFWLTREENLEGVIK